MTHTTKALGAEAASLLAVLLVIGFAPTARAQQPDAGVAPDAVTVTASPGKGIVARTARGVEGAPRFVGRLQLDASF